MTIQQTTPEKFTPVTQALFSEFRAGEPGVSFAEQEHDGLAEALGVEESRLLEICANGLWSYLAEKRSIDICRSAWELARLEVDNGDVKIGEALAEVVCSLLEVGEHGIAQEKFIELSSLALEGLAAANPGEA